MRLLKNVSLYVMPQGGISARFMRALKKISNTVFTATVKVADTMSAEFFRRTYIFQPGIIKQQIKFFVLP